MAASHYAPSPLDCCLQDTLTNARKSLFYRGIQQTWYATVYRINDRRLAPAALEFPCGGSQMRQFLRCN
jgi:hypothetical protein